MESVDSPSHALHRRWPWPVLVALLLACAVAYPASAGSGIWVGIPLDTWIAYAALAVCVSLLVLPRSIGRRSVQVLAVVALLSLVGIASKVVALTQPSAAFAGCYQVLSPVAGEPSRSGTCEKSYDAPFADTWTREDPSLDFGFGGGGQPGTGYRDTNWGISALNSTTYNYFEPDGPVQDRLPLSAQWRGVLGEAGPLTIDYVGEGSVQVGLRTTSLPPSYGAASQVVVEAQTGDVLSLDFRWVPPSSEGPFAALVVRASDGLPVSAAPVAVPGSQAPAVPSIESPSTALALVVNLSLALALLLAAGIVLVYLAHTRPVRAPGQGWYLAAFVLASGWFAATAQAAEAGWAVPVAVISLLLLLSSLRLFWDAAPTRVAATVLISITAIASCLQIRSATGSQFYRPVGNDFLTYEAHARDLLVNGGLRGGEDIFIYSGAMRYWLYLQHLVFGDGDLGIFVLSVAMLLAAGWFAVLRLVITPAIQAPAGSRRLVLGAASWAGVFAVVLLAGLLSTPVVWRGGLVLLSEYPTWVLLSFAFVLALTARGRWPAVAIGVLLGVDLMFRGNQLPGIVAILLVGLWRFAGPAARARQFPASIAAAAWMIIPFAAVGSLGGWHNLAYGGRFIPLATSVPLPVNFPLPPERLAQFGSDPAVAQTLVAQLQGVLGLVYPRELPWELVEYAHFGITVRLIQAGLALALLAGLAHRFHRGWRPTLLVLVPVAFLLPHVFVQVYVYYPRHIVAGYLMGALVLLALAGRWIGDREPEPDPVTSPA